MVWNSDQIVIELTSAKGEVRLSFAFTAMFAATSGFDRLFGHHGDETRSARRIGMTSTAPADSPTPSRGGSGASTSVLAVPALRADIAETITFA